jgi:hypothetical protein
MTVARIGVVAISTDREPLAGLDLAANCLEVVCTAYQGAYEGRNGA